MQVLMAAGTVIIDSEGRVLLRRPTGGYGGYAWTFAKGRVAAGEALEATAARESREETGWTCEVGDMIGDFLGSTSVTRFFIAAPIEFVGKFCDETEATQWCTREEAEKCIAKSHPLVRARDLAVLKAAFDSFTSTGALN